MNPENDEGIVIGTSNSKDELPSEKVKNRLNNSGSKRSRFGSHYQSHSSPYNLRSQSASPYKIDLH